MRVAIAIEAIRCGLSEEEAVRLFKGQEDFDEQYTINQIRFIREKNYKRYSCEKLQDECGFFVKGYCEKCSLLKGEFS
jgi:DNA primase large subunit